MSRFRPSRREVPGLNTASLPDLIFTVMDGFKLGMDFDRADIVVWEAHLIAHFLESLLRGLGFFILFVVLTSDPVHFHAGLFVVVSAAGARFSGRALNDNRSAVDQFRGLLQMQKFHMTFVVFAHFRHPFDSRDKLVTKQSDKTGHQTFSIL